MEKVIEGAIRKIARKIAMIKKNDPPKYLRMKGYAEKLLSTFQPLRIYLLIQGQFPFPVQNDPIVFSGSWSHVMSVFYLICLAFTILVFASVTFGYFLFLFPSLFRLNTIELEVWQEDINNLGSYITVRKDWEKETIRKNLTALLMFYLLLLYLIVMNITVLLRRDAFLNYINYWIFSIQRMEMEIPKSIYKKLMVEIFLAVSVVVSLVGLGVTNIWEGCADVLDITSFLILRPLHSIYDIKVPQEVLVKDTSQMNYYLYKIPGIIVMILSYTGDRCGINHFTFYTRLLTSVSRTWNQRLKDGLEGNEKTSAKSAPKKSATEKSATEKSAPEKSATEKSAPEKPTTPNVKKVRIKLDDLLEDHFTIVHLFKMTEDLFGWQLIIYYSLQTISLIFQLYHLVSIYPNEQVIDGRYGQVGQEGKTVAILQNRLNSEASAHEWWRANIEFGTSLVLILLTCCYIYITSNCANQAYKEGMGGFHVLRRNCYLGACDTTAERNFVHSLVVSFAPNNPIQISAGGYFVVNRSIIPAVMMNVLGYLVAAYTLKPDTSAFWNFGQYANLCQPKQPGVQCP